MARNKRKHNLKIQILAANRLKSFPDARSQKTTTLVISIRKINSLKYKDSEDGHYPKEN